jgi:hypothetical protein
MRGLEKSKISIRSVIFQDCWRFSPFLTQNPTNPTFLNCFITSLWTPSHYGRALLKTMTKILWCGFVCLFLNSFLFFSHSYKFLVKKKKNCDAIICWEEKRESYKIARSKSFFSFSSVPILRNYYYYSQGLVVLCGVYYSD